jgi:hypothetical protein
MELADHKKHYKNRVHTQEMIAQISTRC